MSHGGQSTSPVASFGLHVASRTGATNTIYLLRHGETEWNREGRRQGHLDSPLTPRGREQARTVGRRLRDLFDSASVSLFASSPLGRARETARLVAAELGFDYDSVRFDPLLAEHHMGEWQGLTNAEVDARFGAARHERAGNLWRYVIPGGESYERLYVRAQGWLATVSGESLVIAVAHQMINRTLVGAYAGLTPEEMLALAHLHGDVCRLSGGGAESLR